MFFIIVPLETNPARGTHPAYSIVTMVKRQVLRNGHGRDFICWLGGLGLMSTGPKSVLVIVTISTYVPRAFGSHPWRRCSMPP
ncbi:MAG: hypothetical protein EOP02_08640 [Proteobacteria bacterium]|nr:MAG: hypothetical protein EOP02_08640 [Pseudomonadota bacterium]